MELQFEESIFGCLGHSKTCLIAFFVPFGTCCVQAKAVATTSNNEGYCRAFMLSFCFCAIGAAYNRRHVREFFGISGSLLGDCLCHLLCSPCASSQELREVKKKTRRGSHARTTLGYYANLRQSQVK
jgi:Cys-rich protein (TIGR01571 family)